MIDLRSTRTQLAICALLWGVLVVSTILNRKGPEDFVRTVPQNEIQAFAKAKLSEVQRQSIDANEEICTIIFEDKDGQLGTTDLIVGDRDSCDIAYFDLPGMAPVASIHTHAAFDEEYDSEVPSPQDMVGDIQNGTDGYISTPGGRFWHIDATEQIARQVCREGCLPQDRNFQRCGGFQPELTYTLEELLNRFENNTATC